MSNTYRYERKFVVSTISEKDVEHILNTHKACFSEIFHQRYVNNIYFDTPDLKNYFENIEGAATREKVRIRWYGNLFGEIKKPVLEFKIKNGFLGRKESYHLNPFVLDKNFNQKNFQNIFGQSDISNYPKEKLRYLNPVLLNQYSRKYFQSRDGYYRITIDSNLVFYRMDYQASRFVDKYTDSGHIIVELKYNSSKDDNAPKVGNHLPLRMVSVSKYVSGIERVFGYENR